VGGWDILVSADSSTWQFNSMGPFRDRSLSHGFLGNMNHILIFFEKIFAQNWLGTVCLVSNFQRRIPLLCPTRQFYNCIQEVNKHIESLPLILISNTPQKPWFRIVSHGLVGDFHILGPILLGVLHRGIDALQRWQRTCWSIRSPGIKTWLI